MDIMDNTTATIIAVKRALAQPEQEPVLQDIEQYRMQIAGICTAAIGYWKEGDSIHPDYDTLALRDVAKLYAKYDELYTSPPQRQPLTDEEIEEVAERMEATDAADSFWREFARAIEAKLKEKNA